MKLKQKKNKKLPEIKNYLQQVGTHALSLNFKTCRFINQRESNVPVGILLIVFVLVFIAVAVSTHLYVLCHHFIICLMSSFQGHLACQNFSPTKPHPGKVTVGGGEIVHDREISWREILSVVAFSFDAGSFR